MIAGFLYYCIVFPLSLLPLWVLYRFSDVFYLLLISVFPYRKKVIETNIRNAFPNFSEKDRKTIKHTFYRHFADLIVESVKNLSISTSELNRRFTVENNTILNDLYAEGKNVILVSGHYNNWEWLITSQPTLFKHKPFGIGMPLTSKFWNRKLNERRERFGMHVLNSSTYKTALSSCKEPFAVLTLADQSPVDARKAFWTTFLHQPTAVLFGTEFMAHEYNAAVVYFAIHKVKRGRYVMTLETITSNPKNCKWGDITLKHTQLLERDIQENPAYWLWSHKRWKREIPSDLNELIRIQHETFNRRFFPDTIREQ